MCVSATFWGAANSLHKEKIQYIKTDVNVKMENNVCISDFRVCFYQCLYIEEKFIIISTNNNN